MGAGVLRTIREFALRSQSLTTLVTSLSSTYKTSFTMHIIPPNYGFSRIEDHSSLQKTRMKLNVEITTVGTRKGEKY